MDFRLLATVTAALVFGGIAAAPAATAADPEEGEAVWDASALTILNAQDDEVQVREDPDDPGHRLYQRARSALNRERYQQAAELFGELQQQHPRSTYAADALYWRALALYQLGETHNLEAAQQTLERLEQSYADAAIQREARSLRTRIRAKLARKGNRRAAEDVHKQANQLAEEARAAESRSARDGDGDGDGDDDCEDDTRLMAVQALLNMNSPRAVSILKKVLENRDDCWQLRERALFVLSQNHSPEAADILIEAANGDPHPEVRQQAVFWLSQVPGERSFEAIRDILNNTDEPALQEKCIFALSQHHSPEAGEILRQYAIDASKPEEVRANAIFWLGQGHSNDSYGFLTDLYDDLKQRELKERVIFSISQIDSRESARWLRERALDRKEHVELRKNALFWAAQQGGMECKDFEELYDGFDEREMREQVVFALSQQHDDCAVESLIAIYRKASDDELRKNIVFWLGQSRSDRAFEFIEELIGQ